MADKIRIGMIGVGQIGKRHVKRYSEIPEAEIVAVCDLNQDEAARVAQEYDIPNVYSDFEQMLKRDDIDSVDVCLHNRFHMPMTVAALKAGKHVYCEKPMSWVYQDALKMYQTAQATGKMLHIQLAELYTADTRGAKRLIDEGHLGELYYAKSMHYRRRGRPFVDGYGTPSFVNTKTSGGGAMLDMAVYHISRMVYLLGNPELLAVSGKTYQMLDNIYPDRRQTSGYDVEELGMGMARLAGDITFVLEEAWAIHGSDPATDVVYGSHGGVAVSPLSYHTTLGDMEMDATFDTARAEWRWNQCDPTAIYYTDSQRHWIGAQLGRVPLLDTAGIALKTAYITEGVYVSSALGREVSAREIAQAEPGLGRIK